jgi:hypothetical protein
MNAEFLFVATGIEPEIQAPIFMRTGIERHIPAGFSGQSRTDDIDSAVQGIHAE